MGRYGLVEPPGRKDHRFPVPATLFALGLLLLPACAPWHVGHDTLFAPHIRTVYVPVFQSDSLRLSLAPWLTEGVIKEIELRTPYKVVHDPMADSVLVGRILSDRKQVLIQDVDDQPRLSNFQLRVHVQWFDRQGQLLMQHTITDHVPQIPEAGQSLASAQQQLIQRLAKRIVGRMETRLW